MSPWLPSSSSTARCSLGHTPAVVHWLNRRCAVWNGTSNEGGRSRQAHPLVSTYTIAVNTWRSGSGAVPPPWAREGVVGRVRRAGVFRLRGIRLNSLKALISVAPG